MDKNLLCAESNTEFAVAGKDEVILNDDRVFDVLLESETIYIPQRDPSKKDHLDPDKRKVVAKWMLEVCEEEGCLGPVLPLAINLFDRFLCKSSVPANFLQLIAADCLLIASKMRQCTPIPIDMLCYYSDYSISSCQLKKFELLVVTKLKWDLAAITSFDFVDQILQRIDWCTNRQKKIIRTHSITIIHICCTDMQFFDRKPSLIAAACIICAMNGIRIASTTDFLPYLCAALRIQVEELHAVSSLIEQIVSAETSRLETQSVSEASNKENIYHGKIASNPMIRKSETPVDVQNVNF